LIKSYFFTLTGRFTLSAFIMHLLMIPLLFAGVFYLVESNYRNNFVNQVRNDALILASFSDHTNKYALQYQKKIIEDAIAGGRLLAARIVDENNQVLSTWGDDLPLKKHVEDFFFGEHDDTVFNIIVPRYNTDYILRGELILSYDEKPTQEQISQAYHYGAYLTIAYIGITFTLTILLGRQVTSPIRQLQKDSNEISKGHYDTPLHVNTPIQDIKQLAETLEYMRHELVEKNSALHYQTMHDHLTGLPNRPLLHQRIAVAISEKRQNEKGVALLLIDLDRFKEINDTLGHQTGDEVLKAAALRLRSCVRESDTAARLGGDEFAVLLPQVTRDKAMEIAQIISAQLQQPSNINDTTLQVGASIGVALYPEHATKITGLLHYADIAMYASKHKRQGGVTLYSKSLESSAST